jgi:DNA-binding protein H-NS
MRSFPFFCETQMRISEIEAMDFEELWRLHEELTRVLAEKIVAEKRELEKRLAQLVGGEAGGDIGDEGLAGLIGFLHRLTPHTHLGAPKPAP